MTLQGVPIVIDLYLLPLEGSDAVLGAQWLRTLGPIVWDFSKLLMKFQVGEKEVTLQGMSVPQNKVVNAKEINRDLRKEKQGILLQLYSLSIKASPNTIHRQLQQLLTSYADVFAEPTGLPPPRSRDHRVSLVQGSGPVCVRPYRHPHF